MQRRWPVLLPSLGVLLLYLPVIFYSLVWDDTTFLRDSPIYRDASLWTESLHRSFLFSPNYFRPLGLLSFITELSIAGISPRLFHLTNVLLHALNTALVAALARRLWRRGGDGASDGSLLAVGAGLLYGLHPALIEGVAFISARFDLLLTSGLLVALWADSALRTPGRRALAVGGAFFVAALAKEMAAAFLLVLPLWHLARAETSELPAWKALSRRENLPVYGAVGLAALGVLLLRRACLGYLLFPGAVSALPTGTALQHVLLVARSLTGYALLLLWPFTTLTPIHHESLPIPLSDVRGWLALATAGGMIAALGVGVYRRSRPATLGLAGLVSLLPVLNLRPLELGGGAFIAERFLLFPLALFVLGAVAALEPLVQRRVGRWLGLGWLVGCVAAVQITLPSWRDDEALWRWGAERAPLSETPEANLALQAINQGRIEEGLMHGRRAAELNPRNANVWNTVGLAQHRLRLYPEALQSFEKATQLEPRAALYWSNLAGTLREQGKLEPAAQVLKQALTLDPNLPSAHLNLGLVHLRSERPDLALPPLQRALQLLPPDKRQEAKGLLDQVGQPAPWLRCAEKLLSQGDAAAASQAIGQAEALGAAAGEVAIARSAVLITQNDWERAASVLQLALAREPENPRLYNNLGITARERGDSAAARALFLKATELAPQWALPRQNLARLSTEPTPATGG